MKFHGDVAGIVQLAELAKNVGIVDFAGAGMMAAGHVGDVDEIDEIQILFELSEEVPGRDLLGKEIVEECDVGMAEGTDDVEACGGVRKEIFGIFFTSKSRPVTSSLSSKRIWISSISSTSPTCPAAIIP